MAWNLSYYPYFKSVNRPVATARQKYQTFLENSREEKRSKKTVTK